MRPLPLNRVKWSLFWNLTLIFFVSSLVLVALVADFSGLLRPQRTTVHDVFRKNFAHYLTLLAGQIGDPPDLGRAAALAQELELGISIHTPRLDWASSPGLPPISRCEESGRKGVEGVTVWNPEPYHFYYVVDRGGEAIAFSLSGSLPPAFPTARLIRLIVVIVCVLLLTYLMVSYLVNPLSPLLRGVEELTRGNLDYRIALRGRGEFSRLADSFNQMAQKVQDMLKAREQLTLDVSHELRSPLTRMKLALEMMPASRRRETIWKAARDMETMLVEILEGEKLKNPYGGLAKERLNLGSLAKKVAAGFRGEKPGLRLSGEGSLWVEADAARLATALRNVMENALKYSANQRAPVEVRWGRGGSGAGALAKVEVRDHGAGIPPGEQAFVFEPFYRVDKSRARETGGYGLGLSLCRQILEAHGGRIGLKSDGKSGTTVILELPLGKEG